MIVHGWRYSVKRLDCPTNDLLHVLLILSYYNTFWGVIMPEILFCCNSILLGQTGRPQGSTPPHSTALAPTILRLHSLRHPICARTPVKPQPNLLPEGVRSEEHTSETPVTLESRMPSSA